MALFHARVQKPDEHLNTFAKDLVRKLDEAFPMGDEHMKANLILEQFIVGLQFDGQRNFVFLHSPKTIQEAMDQFRKLIKLKVKLETLDLNAI